MADGLVGLLGELGAHAGGVFLLTGESTMELAVLAGMPRDIMRPWERVRLPSPMPAADALQEEGVVWVGGPEEMARRYPRTALTLPYDFRMAGCPLRINAREYGSLFLVWPAAHGAQLRRRERDRIIAGATRLARILERAERDGRPIEPGPRPYIPAPAPARGDGSSGDPMAALVSRIPEGLCSMDVQGRLTVVSPAAASLLGEHVGRLLGVQPWTVLPWLNNPMFEDRYRSAVMSQESTSFVALRPPDQWLSFHLFPDPTGISVRIVPTHAERPAEDVPAPPLAPDPEGGLTVPSRAGAIYHILNLASAMTEAVGEQDVIDLVVDQVMPAFGGQALALLAEQGGTLRVIGSSGYGPEDIERFDRTPVTPRTPGARTLLTGVPAFVESRRELERAYRSRASAHDGMGAWAFLPLISSGRSVGACVLAYSQPRRFTVEERSVLNSLGGLIAQALERARLYDTKQALAHGLQVGLLPRELPSIPGLTAAARYLPGTEGMAIGGDFYDIIRIDEDRVAAVIGDIQGHNVGAAALMGQVRTAVRAYTDTSDGEPGRVLAHTNSMLVDLDPGLFASCTYLRMDLKKEIVEFARAGHPQPLMRAPEGKTQVLDVPGGVLLGIVPDAQYPQIQLAMPVGSVLALYTDGLVESPGVDLDEAISGLAGRLGEVGGRYLGEAADVLTREAQEARQRADDVALLLLRAGNGPHGKVVDPHEHAQELPRSGGGTRHTTGAAGP
ncbi:SpoIIE family protein phosphatase [Nocardiopsis sediminis]|uniref:SpoIIE family protein phosphatase n=1 Tax=Nocardiopsis sediminis TaxID=1778267 RepID=A0ABV8FIB5_9ACTN